MNKTSRKIHYIDVSQMSEKEICKLLNIEYVPWYKDKVMWGVVWVVIACLGNAYLVGI